MTAQDHISISPDHVTVIFDPERVIDFLTELQDRSIIQYLEKIGHGDTPAIIIHRGRSDGFYTLVLFNYPGWMSPEEESPGKVAIYAYKDLEGLIAYFYRMHSQMAPPEQAVIKDILFLLYQKRDEARHLPPL